MLKKLKSFWCCSSHYYADSLEDKLMCELRNAFLLIVFISSLIYFIGFNHNEKFDSSSFILNLIEILVFLIFYLISLKFILKRALEKHIFKRFTKVREDILKIRAGSHSSRLTTFGTDEFDKIIFFANSIIDKFEEKLELEKNLSLVDPLTSCFNRRALKINFEALKEKIIREESHMCVLSFDLDRFKRVNDTYGHEVGDKVLVEVSNVLREQVRKYDVIYRLGGEEFLVTFPNITPTQAKKLIARIQTQITYSLKKRVPKVKQEVTISGGFYCANYNQLKLLTLDNILKQCDTKLYEAKNSGRNKVLEA